MYALLTLLHLHLTSPRADRDDRGDVPGWVMIAVVTAGLAAGLYEVAGPALKDMLTSALGSVRP